MNIKEQLKMSVSKEYLEYRDAQITKRSDIVFDESYKNLFYIEMYNFFQSDENGLTNDEIKTLAKDKDEVLSNLWDFAMNSVDAPAFLQWEDIHRFVADYTDYIGSQDTMS